MALLIQKEVRPNELMNKRTNPMHIIAVLAASLWSLTGSFSKLRVSTYAL